MKLIGGLLIGLGLLIEGALVADYLWASLSADYLGNLSIVPFILLSFGLCA